MAESPVISHGATAGADDASLAQSTPSTDESPFADFGDDEDALPGVFPSGDEPDADLEALISDLERLSGLREAPYNPRHMPPERMRRLEHSVRRFGDIAGITFNIRTGNLIAAHQRLAALKAVFGDLKLDDHEAVRAAVLDFEPPEAWVWVTDPKGHRWNIRLVRWAPSMERAANLAANAFTLQGMFSAELDEVLTGLQFDEASDYEALGLGMLEVESEGFGE